MVEILHASSWDQKANILCHDSQKQKQNFLHIQRQTYSSFSSEGRAVRRFIINLTSRSRARIWAKGVTMMSSNPFLKIKPCQNRKFTWLLVAIPRDWKTWRYMRERVRYTTFYQQLEMWFQPLTALRLRFTLAQLFGPLDLRLRPKNKSNSTSRRFQRRHPRRKTCAFCFVLFDCFVCLFCCFAPTPNQTTRHTKI